MIAARNINSDSVRQAVEKNPSLKPLPVQKALAEADVIFLATPFEAVESALREAGDLSGKILVDCTNPVGPGMSHGLQNTHYAGYGDLKPAMLIAGNDPAAKKVVGDLCRELGWEPVDTGDVSMSLHLEHMTLLWIKMARVQGVGAGFVWAMLKK